MLQNTLTWNFNHRHNQVTGNFHSHATRSTKAHKNTTQCALSKAETKRATVKIEPYKPNNANVNLSTLKAFFD